jgi:hypothetical protein
VAVIIARNRCIWVPIILGPVNHPLPPLAPRLGSLSTPHARRPEELDAAGVRKRRSPPPVVTPPPSGKEEDLGGPPDLAPTWRRPPNLALEKGADKPQIWAAESSGTEEEGEGRSSRELRRRRCAMKEEGERGLPGHRVGGRAGSPALEAASRHGGHLDASSGRRSVAPKDPDHASGEAVGKPAGGGDGERMASSAMQGKRSSGGWFVGGITDRSIAAAFLSPSVKRFWHVGHVGYTDGDAGGAVRPALRWKKWRWRGGVRAPLELGGRGPFLGGGGGGGVRRDGLASGDGG